MKYLYTLGLTLFSYLGFSQTIGLQQFATGFTDPVDIVNAGDDRLFVVLQDGQIKVLNANGTTNATNFLNISSLTNGGGEQGLLGLAFHPNYTNNGYFYINYTNNSGNTVIARYSVSTANPNTANASSGSILLTITQPYSNHNGGTLRFGPDGYLYIGMGDGGSGGDPGNRSQNINELLGKMLRIDVDSASPYGIPPTNPFVGIAGADEIWATGMRNPWKFSFDSPTGDFWIADVGQENVEEINKMPATAAGINYGWRCYEGNSPYLTSGCAAQSTMTFPFAQYSSASGSGRCSITGGYVYRGSNYPNFQGKYFFADYCSNKLGTVDAQGLMIFSANLPLPEYYFTTFGVDSNNELYVAAGINGTIYKVVDTSLGTEEINTTDFSVYPNPANDTFSIKAKNLQFPIQLSVFDISGKKIVDKKINDEETLVDINQIQSGLYVVTIEDNSGIKTSSKLNVK